MLQKVRPQPRRVDVLETRFRFMQSQSIDAEKKNKKKTQNFSKDEQSYNMRFSIIHGKCIFKCSKLHIVMRILFTYKSIFNKTAI